MNLFLVPIYLAACFEITLKLVRVCIVKLVQNLTINKP